MDVKYKKYIKFGIFPLIVAFLALIIIHPKIEITGNSEVLARALILTGLIISIALFVVFLLPILLKKKIERTLSKEKAIDFFTKAYFDLRKEKLKPSLVGFDVFYVKEAEGRKAHKVEIYTFEKDKLPVEYVTFKVVNGDYKNFQIWDNTSFEEAYDKLNNLRYESTGLQITPTTAPERAQPSKLKEVHTEDLKVEELKRLLKGEE